MKKCRFAIFDGDNTRAYIIVNALKNAKMLPMYMLKKCITIH